MFYKQLLLQVAVASAVSHVSAGCVKPRADFVALSASGNETADYTTIQSLAAAASTSTKALADAYFAAGNSTCNSDNIRVRREWGSLNDTSKAEYISAVQCLQATSALTPASAAPGAKTRFDDFVATHINQTLSIHFTGNFLPFHRYFIYLYEEALRSECDFTGDLPYWDWALTAQTGLEASPVFDGSDLSMSGNGEYVADKQAIVLGLSLGLTPVYLPAGTGGGCVTSGPFANMSVNLGPASLDLPGGTTVTNVDGVMAYNPRCLMRDLTDYVNQKYSNATAVLSNIADYDNVLDFQEVMQGKPGSGSIGIHGGGHYSIGGDPGRDTFTSPGDPAFYLHHAMVDRAWWMWQMQNPEERQYGDTALMGTITFMNLVSSRNATFDDILDYGYAAGPSMAIKQAMSTVAGPFCYTYV